MSLKDRFGSGSRLGAHILIAAVALASASCTSKRSLRQATPVDDRVVVVVVNHNWSDMRVYLLSSSGMRRRLGMVRTGERITFRLPYSYLAGSHQYELLASFIGSGTEYRSGPVQAYYGAQTIWTVENSLAMSTLFVR